VQHRSQGISPGFFGLILLAIISMLLSRIIEFGWVALHMALLLLWTLLDFVRRIVGRTFSTGLPRDDPVLARRLGP
jgi:hypothetical protein